MTGRVTEARATPTPDSPEMQPWLRLYEEVRRGLDAPPWARVTHAAATAEDAPLLADAVIAVDVAPARRLLRGLFERAASAGPPATSLDPARLTGDRTLTLLGAAVAEDGWRIGALALALGADPGALGAVAALGVMPLLHACRRTLPTSVPEAWAHGYCPVCGGWPTLAEARGVERSRCFCCARCGGDWFAGWLRCPYCGNADHRRSAALVDGGAAGTRHRVDTCEACQGYVKTLTVLVATEPAEIALADLRSVSLDLAAIEHGYRRPAGTGRLSSTRVVAAERPA
jgi:FdhE protein